MLEVLAHLGGRLQGAFPVLDALERTHQPVGGVVVVRHGAVAGTALRAEREPERPLLRDANVEGVAFLPHDLRGSAATLIDDVFAVQQVRVVAVQELHAEGRSGLLVGDSHEDQVALERQTVAVMEEEGDELHDAHPLHVL